MDIGTVLDGKDAVDEGLIDYLGNLSDALSCLYGIIDKIKGNKEKKQKNINSKNDSKSTTKKKEKINRKASNKK